MKRHKLIAICFISALGFSAAGAKSRQECEGEYFRLYQEGSMECSKLADTEKQNCNLALEKRAEAKRAECKNANSGTSGKSDCSRKVQLAIAQGTKACKRAKPSERKECLAQLKMQAAEQQALCP